MRLVFLGSPESVLGPLMTLVNGSAAHGHQLVAVVSQPPRPVGRRQSTPVDPPVAAKAREHGIPVLQPVKASDPGFLAELRALAPDVAITAAYGQILTSEFLAIPRRGTINIHPSLLPRHRGATPVPAALLAGDKVTGVTVLFTVKALDAGAIILQEQAAVEPGETAGPLTNRLFDMGARLLMPALALLADPDFKGKPQEEAQVTHCRKITKEDGAVHWERPAENIYNTFRAYSPWPGCYTDLGERRISLTAMAPGPVDGPGLAPGEFRYERTGQCLVVGTGQGQLRLLRLKPAGGREMDAAAFWNGLQDKSMLVMRTNG